MKIVPVTFMVYSEDDNADGLQDALNGFVRNQLQKGGVVTSRLLKDAIDRFGDSYIVTNYFRYR